MIYERFMNGTMDLKTKALLIIIGVLLIINIIQWIAGKIKDLKHKKEISNASLKNKEIIAQTTEIRDESYVKLNDENKKLKDEIEVLKKEKQNLISNIDRLENLDVDKVESQIVNNAIEKIKANPTTCPIFMSFWPAAYDEAKREYEDSKLGKKIFDFVTLKNLRESNNIESKKVEGIEEKS